MVYIPQVRLDKEHPEATIVLKGKRGAFNIAMDSHALFGAQRTDLGAPFNLKRPVGFRERIDVMWQGYDYDSGFKYLIDRFSHYGANGYTFFSKKQEELEFWEEWSLRINEGLPSILPGLREIIKWNIKHLALGALAYNNWLWGKMRIGKRDYEVPVKWNLQNQRAIVITKKGSGFSDEQIGIKIDKNWQQEGDTNWQKAYDIVQADSMKQDMNYIVPKDKDSYFLLKFNTSPGDNTIDDSRPQVAEIAASLYPTPPFYSLLPVLKTRQQLRTMDLNIIDGFINKLVIWKIGNKEFPPLPEKRDKDDKVIQVGTINEVKVLVTKENKGNVLQLFVPYWVDLDIKTPDINPLISTEKYMQPWVEMLWAFGILVDPEKSGTQFKDVNTQNFEQMVDFYRTEHIEPMLENVLFREIASRNDLKIPEIRFNPLNTINNDFLRNIRELAGLGKVSTNTLLKFHKLDKKYELPLIMDELDEEKFKGIWSSWSENEIFNTNTPIRFKQATVSTTGTEEQQNLGTTKTAPQTKVKIGTEVPGRPKGAIDRTKRKKKGEKE